MNDSRADDIIKRHERMESDRATWESHWREISERVLPRAAVFEKSQPVQGEKRTEKIFDSTPVLALERFAAAMESMLTPRTQRWHKLTVKDPELNEYKPVRMYLDEVTDILFAARYSPRANFASQAHENYLSLGAFGTGAIFIDDDLGQGLRYRALHLAELFFCENHSGVIDTVHRKFPFSARQAAQRFGAKNLPEKIRNCLEKNPDEKFDFIHCVRPRNDIAYGRKDFRGMPWESYYVVPEGRAVVAEGGYRAFPYAVSRYVTAPRETYGRSPAMTALSDIKMLNEMSKTMLRAAHKAVDPPLLLHEDGVLRAFDLRPGALNYGGVDDQGRQLVQPLDTGARIDWGMDLLEERRRAINDAFLISLFQILVDQPNMTATEAMLRAQEKGALLAPTMGRQQSEMLGPLIERELDILAAAGALPPPPPELIEMGIDIDIEYVSPLNRMQRAEDGVGIMRTLEAVTPLAQIDPTVLDVFDPEGIVRELAEINGVPAKVLRSPEEMEALKDQRAQQQQAAQLLEAAPVASKVATDLAAIQSTAQNAPQPMALPAV